MPAHRMDRRFDRRSLVASFRSVGLGLKILGGPLEPSNPAIFQMDITRTRRFGEYLRIWPGSRDNEIEALGGDARLAQLVLRVKEARRRFTRKLTRSAWMATRAVAEAEAQANGGRIVADTGNGWLVELWTPEQERRYLCGRDDVNLFIAEVPRGETVREVHAGLKPRAVVDAEVRGVGPILRQGEWFFVPLDARQAADLAGYLANQPGPAKPSRPVGPGARPHLVDERVNLRRRAPGKTTGRIREEIYVRGLVRHPDHRLLLLPDWHRVFRNAEVVSRRGDGRLRWID